MAFDLPVVVPLDQQLSPPSPREEHHHERLLRGENDVFDPSENSTSTTPITTTPAIAPPAKATSRGLQPASGITLQAIGLTLVGGLCISFLTVLAFGIAVIYRHKNIAPRCTSRHPNTIWRSRKDMYGSSLQGFTKKKRESTSKKKGDKKKKKKKKGGSVEEEEDDDLNNTINSRNIASLADDGVGSELRSASSVEVTLNGAMDSQTIAALVDDGVGSELRSLPEGRQMQDPPPPVARKDNPSIQLTFSKEDGDDDEEEYQENSSNQMNRHPQDRGNPFLGWIPWTLRLSYDRMLRGIPGTGTREGGMSGKLLGVNLDAIILFRYHALCLRVTAVACFLCIGIILPLNLTACDTNCTNGLTNYGKTTIANVGSKSTTSTCGETTTTTTNDYSINVFSSFFWGVSGQDGSSFLRYYVIALCTWYITYFVLKNIERDWKENLVLRRVYYLEADHYGNRQVELAETVYKTTDPEQPLSPRSAGGCGKGGEEGDKGVSTGKHEHRNPWIPNPEYRDTVPSIELYSVLVGGLPSLPDEVVNSKEDMQTALGYSNRASIDWQLAVATTFFDHCVPNQPGFSSSVVAVTILPGAPELAKAWRKWYAAAAALRRLRFIRQVISAKRYYDIDVDEECCGAESPSSKLASEQQDANNESPFKEDPFRNYVTPADRHVTIANHHEQCIDVETGQPFSPGAAKEDSLEKDYRLFRSLNYGPEQQAVYTREFAQGAAACCPNGCCEERVRRQPIDKLLEMEDATIIRLENAQYELQCAQMQAAVSTVERADKKVIESSQDEVDKSLSADSIGALPSKTTFKKPTVDVSPRTLGPGGVSFEENEATGNGVSTPTNGSAVLSNRKVQSPIPGASRLRMNSEGMFLFDNDEVDSTEPVRGLTAESSLRRRINSEFSSNISEGGASRATNQWNQVNSILRRNTQHEDNFDEGRGISANLSFIATGVWEKPSFKSFMAAVKSDVLSSLNAVKRWTKRKTDNVTSKLAKDSTYAVVTFSSRQAAVAARHCLADGRGVERWLEVDTVPVSPLADAAPCDIITCRGCCRPVTLNLNRNQLMIRRYLALASLAFIYTFYTIPITMAQSLVSPDNLKDTMRPVYDWIDSSQYLSADILSGLVSALLYTLFFALCPVIFKAIANSGSRATSVQEAEKYALKYYWYFMLVTAFAFTYLADTAINIYNHGGNVEDSIECLLRNIAAQTPLTTAATWLNWIIVRTTMTLPLQYLLQVNSFGFEWLGWKCCARCVMGGGPGGPTPYRIYIDGGVVFLCVVALAPQSPLVAPVALLYYLVCVPLWRRNCIFMYRPKFDSGGERWPFLSDMLITSLFMGQFLLTLQLVLRDAFGPALISACPSVSTYLFRNYLMKRFKRAYDDAGLLQTSLLDGWDNSIPTSIESREEFRQFLVDAHKAAYIPVCIAGGATNILTAEPAVVLPSENDDMLGYGDLATTGLPMNGIEGVSTPNASSQRGACVRRTTGLTPRSSTTETLWQKVQDKVSATTAEFEM